MNLHAVIHPNRIWDFGNETIGICWTLTFSILDINKDNTHVYLHRSTHLHAKLRKMSVLRELRNIVIF